VIPIKLLARAGFWWVFFGDKKGSLILSDLSFIAQRMEGLSGVLG